MPSKSFAPVITYEEQEKFIGEVRRHLPSDCDGWVGFKFPPLSLTCNVWNVANDVPQWEVSRKVKDVGDMEEAKGIALASVEAINEKRGLNVSG